MKKYNLSAIMKKANSYAKTMSRGEALRKAWAEEKVAVKVDEIDTRCFYLNMKDYLTPADFAKLREWNNEKRRLLNSVKEPQPGNSLGKTA